MFTRPVYCTVEQVRDTLDLAFSGAAQARVEQALCSGADAVDNLMQHPFYPEVATRSFDWPDLGTPTNPWRLYFGQHPLHSLTGLVSGGVTADVDGLFLYPDDGPPYRFVEFDRSGEDAFIEGATPQNNIEVSGVWGWLGSVTQVTTVDGAAVAADEFVDVLDSTAIGAGSTLLVGAEYVQVTRKAWVSVDALTSGVSASTTANSVGVSDGTAFQPGQQILVGSERMLVVDVVSNTLLVKRAVSGTTLAAHSTSSAVYSPNSLQVTRAFSGSTAADIDDAAPVYLVNPPAAIVELALAEAINTLYSGAAGWARTVGTGDFQREAVGKGLEQLRRSAFAKYGRKGRVRSV